MTYVPQDDAFASSSIDDVLDVLAVETQSQTVETPTQTVESLDLTGNEFPGEEFTIDDPTTANLALVESSEAEESPKADESFVEAEESFVEIESVEPIGWADLGVPSDMVDVLHSEGMTMPFPVQIATLPDAMAGRDICGEAPTGSGKTLAYGIAALTKVGVVRPRRPHALILVPVRELAEQTSRALTPLGRGRRIWVQPLVGGVDINRHSEALRRGAGVIVATPGRLMDLLGRGDVLFDDLTVIVIDEADRMADMGFMPQVRGILDEVPKSDKGRPQMLLFSATLDGDVAELIREFQTNPARHSTKGVGLSGQEEGEHIDTVGDHLRVLVRHDDKLDVAAQIVAPARRSLMFVRNRFATERVALALEERGVPATFLHGGLTQSARNRALRDWAFGKVRTVVATDMVARGLHMDDVDVVVHLDPPQDEKDYVHRSGRTGRAGAAGTVVNLLRKEQRRSADALERRLGVTSREASVDEVVERLKTQVEESLAAPISSKVATPVPVVMGAEDRDASGFDRGGRSGGWDSNRGSNDRGSRDRGFGGGDRGGRGFESRGRSDGSRPSGGRPSGDRPSWSGSRPDSRSDSRPQGGFGGSDRGSRSFEPRSPRPAGDRPNRPWVPQEEWDRQRAERFAGNSGSDRPTWSATPRGGGSERGFERADRNFDRPERTVDRPARSFDRPERSEVTGRDERGFEARTPRHEGEGASRPWVPKEEWERQRADRPDRGFGGGERSGGDRGFGGPRRDSNDRGFDRGGSDRGGSDRGGSDRGGSDRAGRGFDARGPRPAGDRPNRPWVPQEEWDAQRSSRPGAGRPSGGRSFGDRPGGDRPSADRPSWSSGPRTGGADRGFESRSPRPDGDRPYGGGSSAGRPSGDRPSRPWVPQEEWDAQRSSRPGAGRPTGDRPSGGRSFGDRSAPGGRGDSRSDNRGGDSRGGSGNYRPGGDRPNTAGYIPRGVKMWQAGKRKPQD